MARRPVDTVRHVPTDDRRLLRVGPDEIHWDLQVPLNPEHYVEDAIVWLKPPPNVDPTRLEDVIQGFKNGGAIVKLLPPDRVDAIVHSVDGHSKEPEVTELGASDVREVVAQVCAELARLHGVSVDEVTREAETYLSAAGI